MGASAGQTWAAVGCVCLLACSCCVMTAAWYLHLKYKEWPMWKAILFSWLFAFFEYCLQVPGGGASMRAHAFLFPSRATGSSYPVLSWQPTGSGTVTPSCLQRHCAPSLRCIRGLGFRASRLRKAHLDTYLCARGHAHAHAHMCAHTIYTYTAGGDPFQFHPVSKICASGAREGESYAWICAGLRRRVHLGTAQKLK